MGLLSSIAAALSQGVGNGMVASAKWGIEKEAQAKREAAENARLDKQMERLDKQIASQEKMSKDEMTFRSSEAKKQREWEADQKRLDREAELARSRSVRSGSNSDELRGLKFVDGKITDFDTQIGNLMKAHDSEIDPQRQQVIADQIDVLLAQRKNFITSPATLNILASSGSFGQAYAAALFPPKQAQTEQTDKQTIPSSIKAPDRPKIPERPVSQINTGGKASYPTSSAFTSPDGYNGTAQSLYRGGGTTEDDARHAVSKLGYNIPTHY